MDVSLENDFMLFFAESPLVGERNHRIARRRPFETRRLFFLSGEEVRNMTSSFANPVVVIFMSASAAM